MSSKRDAELASEFEILAQACTNVARLLRGAPREEPMPRHLSTLRQHIDETEDDDVSTPSTARSSELPPVEKRAVDRKILVALAQFGKPMTTAMIGLVAGISHRTGPFGMAMSRHRQAGFVADEPSRRVSITKKGLKEVGDFQPFPTGRRLFDMWCQKFGSPASKILETLRAQDVPLTRKQVGECAGISHRTGPFNMAVSKLKKLQILDDNGKLSFSKDFRSAAIEPTIAVFDKVTGVTHRVGAHTGTVR